MAKGPRGYVYFVQAEGNGFIKIGYSWHYPDRRLSAHMVSCPVRLLRLGYLRGSLKLERLMHSKFSEARTHGEWFVPCESLMEFVRIETHPWLPAKDCDYFPEDIPSDPNRLMPTFDDPTPTMKVNPLYEPLTRVEYSDPEDMASLFDCPLCGNQVYGNDQYKLCTGYDCPFGRSDRDGQDKFFFGVAERLLMLCRDGSIASRNSHAHVRKTFRELLYIVKTMRGETQTFQAPERRRRKSAV